MNIPVRSLSINMTGVRVRAELKVDMVRECNGAVVTSISFPLAYRDIDFEFENIGTVLGVGVDILGELIIRREKENLVRLVREGIGREVRSLVCKERGKGGFGKPLLVDTLDPTSPAYRDTVFKEVLNREGIVLIRDR